MLFEQALLIVVLVLSGSLTMVLWRWVRGPTVADKAIAFVLVMLHLIALLTLSAIRTHTTALFDVIIALSIATMLSIQAMARYMGEGRQ